MTLDEKVNVLVLGGVGFIGRNFIHYLSTNNLVADIRVADKMLPQTAYLSETFKTEFSKIEFKQTNLINQASIAACFDREDGKEFDYVFNFAAETKYSQVPEIYQERIFNLSVNCAKEAAKRNVKLFIEMSTAEVYDSNQEASTETSKINPWTVIAKHKYKAEEALKKIEGLNLIILRPAVVYGPGALLGLTPRLIIGRIYKYLDEEMKLLWSKDLKLNTVHVDDVSRACWYLAQWYTDNSIGATGQVPVFNLVDKQDTDQEAINKQLQTIFDIKTGYHGSVVSTFAKLNLDAVIEAVNEKHLAPWAELVKNNGIANTPLSPYLDEELLYNNALSVDGSKIERETGFTYSVPYLTREKLIEIIDGYKALQVWPKD
ncbi:NAD-dependent epimerase/dehydratase [Mucor ambiguus]|uniref:NAD-dependent epimerase/dehydratase n=1 Tax=Mucor ambiguus TaxID=91626 RepID=A0A0C9MVK2_9FUNG|nr:NAD-dependent epimerase/dehydratase [Mucor ambiguus]